MRRLQRYSRLMVAVGLLMAGAACGPFGGGGSPTGALRTPPPPAPAEDTPPVINEPFDPGRNSPLVEWAILSVTHTPEINAVLAESDRRFRAGEAFFEQGDAENARRLFDRSIEILLDAPPDALDHHRVEEHCAELVDAIYGYDVDGLGASEQEPGFEASPYEEALAATFPVDPSIPLNVVEELKLPVSELPIEVNGDVLRYIKYFQTPRGKRKLEDGLRRMGRYRPMIQRILEEEGVPRELIYLAQVESGFIPRALSRRRATGMWQFMRLRASEYGLHRSRYYDDRLDPEKATRAAARHLRDLYRQMGDWYLAMCAYNAGPSRVNRAVRRTGYADFWEFRRRKVLPRETRNYIPMILAMIIMAENPGEYGLDDVVPDPPLEYNTIEVTANTHLGLIADILGKPLADLRALNPALLKDIVPAGYTVHVPKGTGNFLTASLNTVPASRRAAWRLHRVGYGETLAQIAKMYKTTREKIAVANGGALATPETGDLVVVPVSYAPPRSAKQRRFRHHRHKKPVKKSAVTNNIDTGG